MKYATYHETLGATVTTALTCLTNHEVVIEESEISGPFMYDGLAYERTKEAHTQILSLKGKPTKKWVHVTIYRMSSGRYELTMYLL